MGVVADSRRDIQDFQCCLTIKGYCEITRAITGWRPDGAMPVDRPHGVPRRGYSLGITHPYGDTYLLFLFPAQRNTATSFSHSAMPGFFVTIRTQQA